MNSEMFNDEICPLGCEAKHLLSACPVYQKSTVDQRWEIVKQNNRCRKCLRNHHTNHCTKPHGNTCNKCTRRHHRSLHNNRIPPAVNSSLDPEAVPFASASQEANNHNVQGERNIPGLCPVQKVKIKDKDGNFVEVLAMLESGSNISFISKNVKKKLGLSGTKTRLTMNLAGGNKKSEWSQRTINVDTVDKKLIPASDEQGVLRAHGRLENIRSLPAEMGNPIILPNGHQLVIEVNKGL